MKTVREITLNLLNEPGTLAQVSDLLTRGGVDVLALSVHRGPEGSILHLIASDGDRASEILKHAGMNPEFGDVVAAEVPQHYGGLDALLRPLKRANVNVEHMYSSMALGLEGHRTILFIAVDDLTTACASLEREWIRLYGDDLCPA